MRTPAFSARMPSITGITRRSSSRSVTGSAPGRVDSPPMSSRSAPSNASRRPWLTAASRSRNAPPSENESGVTLSTPMMRNTRAMLPPSVAPQQRGDRQRREAERAGLGLLPEDELRDREQDLGAGGREQDPGARDVAAQHANRAGQERRSHRERDHGHERVGAPL